MYRYIGWTWTVDGKTVPFTLEDWKSMVETSSSEDTLIDIEEPTMQVFLYDIDTAGEEERSVAYLRNIYNNKGTGFLSFTLFEFRGGMEVEVTYKLEWGDLG